MSRRFGFYIRCLLLIAAAHITAIAVCQDIDSLYIKGSNDYEDGYYENAIRSLNSVLSLDPDHYKALLKRAQAWHKLGEFSRAGKDYATAEHIQPEDPELLFSWGVLLVNMSKLKDGIKMLTKSIEKDPSNARAFYYRAYAWSQLKKNENALADYNEAIKIDPEYTDAYLARGAVKGNLGDYNEALMDFTKAENNNADTEDSDYYIAMSFYAMEEYQKAIDRFTKVILSGSSYIDKAYYYRGECKYEMEEPEAACNDWDQAALLGNKTAEKVISESCGEVDMRKRKTKDINIVF